MKQKRNTFWLIAFLCALCLTVLTHRQNQDVAPEQDLTECTDALVVTAQQNQPHEAVLTDASQLYHVCSSRPQRILPVQGSRGERTLTPALNFVRQHIVKPLHSYFDSRCRQESAPFCLPSSCDYYVIALRHIIR